MRFFKGILLYIFIAGAGGTVFAQTGTISGSVVNNTQKSLRNATVSCILLEDTLRKDFFTTDKNGAFSFADLPYGHYRLVITLTGYARKVIDSIHIRTDRNSFNIDNIEMHTQAVQEEEVTVYAEKPLVEMTKDGKIVFNTGESAIAQTSTAGDLLKNTPQVTVDPNGNVLLKGKEVKILVDEKPVELNARQLQDLLESLPGSTIEKIEVLTNPPPQYATERGGVINIVTKKGKAGITLRASMNYGTRGDWGGNLTAGYKKNKASVQLTGNFGHSRFLGGSDSYRQNFYTDSSNRFNSDNDFENLANRPSLRLQTNYDPHKRHQLSLTIQLNRNNADNQSLAHFTNINRYDFAWRISERNIVTDGWNNGTNTALSYTAKSKNQTGVFRFTGGWFTGRNRSDRQFYQVFYDGFYLPTGIDSTQQQLTQVRSHNYSSRFSYDKTFDSGKWMISSGFNYFSNNSNNHLETSVLRKPDNTFIVNPLLSNAFGFHQRIAVGRMALRYLVKTFNVTAGVQSEYTTTDFEMGDTANGFGNRYTSWLPFTNMLWKPNEKWSVNFSYRKSIQRPGVNELNPAVDYSDPYNTRYGNPFLLPAYSHNFDLVVNRWHKQYMWNLATGFNYLTNLYQQLRELQTDGRTTITWKNISSRKEYEISGWGGYNLAKSSRLNLSAGYVYNVYSEADKVRLRYRNGGSFTSSINGNYNLRDRWQFTAIFTYNRFANPQGAVRNNINLNLGAQRKLVQNRLVISLNVVDPFNGQLTRTAVYGSNFVLETNTLSRTRNVKLGIAYNFIKPPKPKKKPVPVKKTGIK